MIRLPWKIKIQRTPRPLPAEIQGLVSMLDVLSDTMVEYKKQLDRIERKVYRELEKDNGDRDIAAMMGTTRPAEADWRTGDPA